MDFKKNALPSLIKNENLKTLKRNENIEYHGGGFNSLHQYIIFHHLYRNLHSSSCPHKKQTKYSDFCIQVTAFSWHDQNVTTANMQCTQACNMQAQLIGLCEAKRKVIYVHKFWAVFFERREEFQNATMLQCSKQKLQGYHMAYGMHAMRWILGRTLHVPT